MQANALTVRESRSVSCLTGERPSMAELSEQNAPPLPGGRRRRPRTPLDLGDLSGVKPWWMVKSLANIFEAVTEVGCGASSVAGCRLETPLTPAPD